MDIFSDPVILSRIQFAFVITFHIIFPALTIGLASWLVVLEGLWLKTNHPIYKEIYQQWVKIFAISFGMGVVSGVVMSYQFGTNWSEFSHKTGNVIGPLMSYEVLTAFFLEASFLGIMLFGWNRVGKKMHFTSTILVAVGTLISTFWIISANSWMHTPAGFRIAPDGVFYPTSWMEIIFNPSFPYRLAHMVLAAYLTTAFVVGAVASWYFLKHKFIAHAKVMFAMAMLMAIFITPIQIIAGHSHGSNTLEYQPAKIAAIEGIWETEKGANLNLFGWPDEKAEETKYAIQIPKGASLVLKGDPNAEIKGLKEWKPEERPPVAITFFAFRIMVGIGVLMLLTGAIAIYLFFRKKLFVTQWFNRWCVCLGPAGFVAIITGWFTTEVGRQPYIVYGVLKTKEAVSPVTAAQVSMSLMMFMVTYTIIFGAGIYYIYKTVKGGPKTGDWHDTYGTHGLKHPSDWTEVFPIIKSVIKGD